MFGFSSCFFRLYIDPFVLSSNVGCVPMLMWFFLEGSDSVSGIMESVAIIFADELKDRGTLSSRCPAPSFFRVDGNITGLLS